MKNSTNGKKDVIFFFFPQRNDIPIASSLNEFTLGACQKTYLLLTMLSALHAKSKVCKAAVSAGWNFNWSTQLTGRRALATETKFECKKNKKNKPTTKKKTKKQRK